MLGGSIPVLSGVPQGSILGPLLFIMYINDIPNAITSSSIYIFADDTKLIKRQCEQEDLNSLQADALNASKCLNINFGRGTSSSLLGVTVNCTLSWTSHIDSICKKAYCSLSLIMQEKHSCTRTIIKPQNVSFTSV